METMLKYTSFWEHHVTEHKTHFWGQICGQIQTICIHTEVHMINYKEVINLKSTTLSDTTVLIVLGCTGCQNSKSAMVFKVVSKVVNSLGF